eukprot:gene14303-60437_t
MLEGTVWARLLPADTEQPWRAFGRDESAVLEEWLDRGDTGPVTVRTTHLLAVGPRVGKDPDDEITLPLSLAPASAPSALSPGTGEMLWSNSGDPYVY